MSVAKPLALFLLLVCLHHGTSLLAQQKPAEPSKELLELLDKSHGEYKSYGDGVKPDSVSAHTPQNIVAPRPVFPGGYSALNNYLVTHIPNLCPEDSARKNFLDFQFNLKVDTAGKVTDVICENEASHASHQQSLEELKTILKNLPDFIPAKEHDKPVESSLSIHIKRCIS